MNSAILAASLLGVLGAFALAMWFIGKQGAAEDRGEQKLRMDDLQAQNDNLRKQRNSLANPPTDQDVEDSLEKGEF
jgi:hypothetical protein